MWTERMRAVAVLLRRVSYEVEVVDTIGKKTHWTFEYNEFVYSHIPFVLFFRPV